MEQPWHRPSLAPRANVCFEEGALFGRRLQPRRKNASAVGVTYLGVSQSSNRWSATLTSKASDAQIPLGVFDSPTEAAAAYDEVSLQGK